jgi:hypothetical protein
MNQPYVSRGTRRLLREIAVVALVLAVGAVVWLALAWSAAVSL